MNKVKIALLSMFVVGSLLASAPLIEASYGPTAQCRDGSYSYAVHHQGACSHHRGVRTWLR